jgi:hypothetical protein
VRTKCASQSIKEGNCTEYTQALVSQYFISGPSKYREMPVPVELAMKDPRTDKRERERERKTCERQRWTDKDVGFLMLSRVV